MNKKSRNSHHAYLKAVIENMADGRERSSEECHAFVTTPHAKDVAKILSAMKIELVEKRSEYRLHKRRVANKKVFWRLERRS